ncbi:aminoacyl-tRNA hydrolase, partial [Francisella tularensis subsp. holarctica]|nr:aminoacyl-tRNA hydrolase [Francisella tularensis subsp. holarctica]
HKTKVANYVLSNPSKAHKKDIDSSIDNGICILDDIINYKLEPVMQKLQTK